MIAMIASLLWIVFIIMMISDRFKKKPETRILYDHGSQIAPEYKTKEGFWNIAKSYPIGSAEEDITNSWIISYIRDKDGKADYEQMKKDFATYISKQLDGIVVNMVNDNMIIHGIDTETFSEYVALRGHHE